MDDKPTSPINLSAMSLEAQANVLAHFTAVGVVACEWAGFELILDQSIIEMGRIPEDSGMCLTSQIAGPARKLDAYIALVRLRGGVAFLKELEAFAKDTTALSERRNRVVHDPWLQFTEGGVASRLETTARRILRHRFVETTRGELVRLCDDIASHANRFCQLHSRILEAVADT
jgi:hypothetical protein